MDSIGTKGYSSTTEMKGRDALLQLMKHSPIPDGQVLENMGLFLTSKDLSRILFLDFLYRQIIDLQGVIFDFGTRWGNNMSVFSALRGTYEPFNRHRKIIGFDTFSGFPSVSEKDGQSDLMKSGNVSVTPDYSSYLEKIIETQENLNPLSHISKFEIVKGDASKTIHEYLNNNPHTIVSLAYFDFDIYQPTKDVLMAICGRIPKGSVLAFDELNDADSPGETLAVKEVYGFPSINLRRYRYASRVSYFVME